MNPDEQKETESPAKAGLFVCLFRIKNNSLYCFYLIGTAATAVTWTEKELSIRKLIIRKAIALLLIEGAILFVALKSDTIPTEKNWVVPCLLAGVFAVYVLSHIILYFIDRREAEKISADLARYQENQKDGIS